jgi:hypothetical protein
VRLINGKTLREFRIEQLRKAGKCDTDGQDALTVLALIRVAECAKRIDDYDCQFPILDGPGVEPIPCGECANCELAAALVDLEAVR